MKRSRAVLIPEDVHHLKAAVGWLELKAPAESLPELDAMSPEGRNHEDALETRWLVLAELKRWEEAVTAAQQMKAVAPERTVGWIHHAFALRRAPGGGLEAAFEALFPAAGKFPRESIIPYNLACYCCQMARPATETLDWLKQAIAIGGRKEIVTMALKDPDLAPLREEIARLAGRRAK